MGVKGLLQQLKPASVHGETPEDTLGEFRHKTLAIDLSGWLYRGAYSCAADLCLGRPTTAYLNFITHRLGLLAHHNIRAIVVADGFFGRSPLKAETNAARREGRAEKIAMARRLVEQSRKEAGATREATLGRADRLFQEAIRLTDEMTKTAIAAVSQMEGVTISVAPYEADSQLAYLCRTGKAQGVITEDSDILVYSVASKCPFPVLYKMDELGRAQKYRMDSSVLGRDASDIDSPFLKRMALLSGDDSPRLFVQMCVLAGCDYLENCKNIALVKASQLVLKFRLVSADSRLRAVVRDINRRRGSEQLVPDSYITRAMQAECLFFYARCFDETSDRTTHFSGEPQYTAFEGSSFPRSAADSHRPVVASEWPADLFGADVSAAKVREVITRHATPSRCLALLSAATSSATSSASASSFSSRTAPLSWSCPACKTSVFPNKDICYRCKTERPGKEKAAKAPSSRPSESALFRAFAKGKPASKVKLDSEPRPKVCVGDMDLFYATSENATSALRTSGSGARPPLQRVTQPATGLKTANSAGKKRTSNPFAMPACGATKRPRSAESTPKHFASAELHHTETPHNDPHVAPDMSPDESNAPRGSGGIPGDNAQVSASHSRAGFEAQGPPSVPQKRALAAMESARGSLGLGRLPSKRPPKGKEGAAFAKARFASFFVR